MSALRALAFYGALTAWTLLMGIFCAPALVLPRAALVCVSRRWARGVVALLAATVGIRHRVVGTVPSGPVIVASKHQSAWETLAYPTVIDDPAVVLKRNLLWVPIFGWYLARLGMIPIDRAGRAGALRRMVNAARRAKAQNRPILVFPEGTRTLPGTRRGYHPGVYALYRELALPVVPAALDSGLFWPRRSIAKHAGVVTIQFLPAIAPGLSRGAFMSELAKRIETASAALLPSR